MSFWHRDPSPGSKAHSMAVPKQFVIACGGTGGHLFPGLAVAETLHERGHEVLLLVSEKEIDTVALRDHPEFRREKLVRMLKNVNPQTPLKYLSHVGAAELNSVRPAFSAAYTVAGKMQNILEAC